ncbi:hypothetical protein E4U15_006893, partial [Claviceps sp. LM218 group G6]
ASLRLRKQRETSVNGYSASIGLSGEILTQPPSLTPTASEIYARGNQFTASPTLGQRGGPDLDDVFAPTSAQPREFIAPSARSSQYHSTTVSDESEAEIDIFTPPVESSNVLQTTHAPVNHPPDVPHPGLPLDPVQVAGELDVPCLTDADQTLLRNFEQAVAKNKLTECPHCLIRWFTIELDRQTGVCKKCTDDKAFREKNPQLPAFWSEENELDPG